jgi:hypothetical protein
VETVPFQNHDLVEVVKGIFGQFPEALPLIDLNLTGHAEDPRGWRDLHLGWTAKHLGASATGDVESRLSSWPTCGGLWEANPTKGHAS